MIASHQKTIYEALGRGPVHPFPARMAPGIALDIVSGSKERLRILDPMMGSGTVIAIARSKGHKAIGVDIDPLAVLLAKVWTSSCDVQAARDKAKEVLRRASELFDSVSQRDAYPRDADKGTRKFVRYWFDEYARKQLTALSRCISRVHDETLRDVLWCAFSRQIITKQAGASLALDLSHSRPHKFFERAPAKPFANFLKSVDRVMDNCLDFGNRRRGPAPVVLQGDARDLFLPDESVDLVLTSPPYLNAIDYLRCSKFSLVWMGHGVNEMRYLRAESVGSEVGMNFADDDEIASIIKELRLRPKLTARTKAILGRYIDDMREALGEVERVLAPKGTAVYVVGENTLRGTYIRNSVIVTAAAELAGLKLHKIQTRDLPADRRYLPPPSNAKRAGALDARMRREVVLAFKKPMQ